MIAAISALILLFALPVSALADERVDLFTPDGKRAGYGGGWRGSKKPPEEHPGASGHGGESGERLRGFAVENLLDGGDLLLRLLFDEIKQLDDLLRCGQAELPGGVDQRRVGHDRLI